MTSARIRYFQTRGKEGMFVRSQLHFFPCQGWRCPLLKEKECQLLLLQIIHTSLLPPRLAFLDGTPVGDSSYAISRIFQSQHTHSHTHSHVHVYTASARHHRILSSSMSIPILYWLVRRSIFLNIPTLIMTTESTGGHKSRMEWNFRHSAVVAESM